MCGHIIMGEEDTPRALKKSALLRCQALLEA